MIRGALPRRVPATTRDRHLTSLYHCGTYIRSANQHRAHGGRHYATVSNSMIAQRPPPGGQSSSHLFKEPEKGDLRPSSIDSRVFSAVMDPSRRATTLQEIIEQYISLSGTILDVSLPYELRPPEERRIKGLSQCSDNLVAVAHCAVAGGEQIITVSSGFALNVRQEESANGGEHVFVTCAHTLEQIRQWAPLLATTQATSKHIQSGSFIVTGPADNLELFPVTRVLSALPRSDLLLLSSCIPDGKIRSLPVSPYPVHKETEIWAHFVQNENSDTSKSWSPWVGDSYGQWVHGRIAGYRDFAGRETEPGTYDALSDLFFTPIPTAGSSGGPLIDRESGAVVGVVLGSRMNNRVEGTVGWGVPSEAIFEMFTLPGLEGKK